jgi:hypothetical protein
MPRAVLALLLMLTTPALGQNVSLHHIGHVPLIVISGDITAETAREALPLIARHRGAILALEGPGGLIAPAIAIGRAARGAGMTTLVPPNGRCASSCALIWMAGRQRLLGPGARLGFHAASAIHPDGRRSTSAQANALVGGYLREMGASDEVLLAFTRAAPHSIDWLGPAQLAALGVAVRLLGEGAAPPRPAAAPRPARPEAGAPEGLWVGQYRCGREVIAARLMVWRDGEGFRASFEFGPSEESPNVAHGAMQMRGSLAEGARLRLSPTEIQLMPPGQTPRGILARVEAERMTGAFDGHGPCGPLALTRARP